MIECLRLERYQAFHLFHGSVPDLQCHIGFVRIEKVAGLPYHFEIPFCIQAHGSYFSHAAFRTFQLIEDVTVFYAIDQHILTHVLDKGRLQEFTIFDEGFPL